MARKSDPIDETQPPGGERRPHLRESRRDPKKGDASLPEMPHLRSDPELADEPRALHRIRDAITALEPEIGLFAGNIGPESNTDLHPHTSTDDMRRSKFRKFRIRIFRTDDSK